VGAALALLLRASDVVALSGDLGAGKTAFVQGIARGLGSADHVASPTFTLVRQYDGGRLQILHMDVYRLDRIQDVLDLGFDELLDGAGVVLIEWGDMIEGILPVDHLVVRLTFPGGSEADLRAMEFDPRGDRWADRAEAVRTMLEPWRDGGE
jgi:tRNA threonylcarbamoyladenosine biosynthesis protein TsaE